MCFISDGSCEGPPWWLRIGGQLCQMQEKERWLLVWMRCLRLLDPLRVYVFDSSWVSNAEEVSKLQILLRLLFTVDNCQCHVAMRRKKELHFLNLEFLFYSANLEMTILPLRPLTFLHFLHLMMNQRWSYKRSGSVTMHVMLQLMQNRLIQELCSSKLILNGKLNKFSSLRLRDSKRRSPIWLIFAYH